MTEHMHSFRVDTAYADKNSPTEPKNHDVSTDTEFW